MAAVRRQDRLIWNTTEGRDSEGHQGVGGRTDSEWCFLGVREESPPRRRGQPHPLSSRDYRKVPVYVYVYASAERDNDRLHTAELHGR